MIKVFEIQTYSYVYGKEEEGTTFVAVQDNEPTEDQAVEIVEADMDNNWEICYGEDDCYRVVEAVEDWVPISLAEFLEHHKLDELLNEDDVLEMQFEYNELPGRAKQAALEGCCEMATDYDWWKDDDCLQAWCDKQKEEYGLTINADDIEFSLAYVQGDYANFEAHVEGHDDLVTFLDAIGFDFDDLSVEKQKVLKAALNSYGSSVQIETTRGRWHVGNYCVDLDLDYSYQEKLELTVSDMWRIIDELEDDIREDMKELPGSLRNNLYWHIRNYYEDYVSCNEAVEDYIESNDLLFDIEGSVL